MKFLLLFVHILCDHDSLPVRVGLPRASPSFNNHAAGMSSFVKRNLGSTQLIFDFGGTGKMHLYQLMRSTMGDVGRLIGRKTGSQRRPQALAHRPLCSGHVESWRGSCGCVSFFNTKVNKSPCLRLLRSALANHQAFSSKFRLKIQRS